MDLPGPQARQKVFEIHLAKRGYRTDLDWTVLLRDSEGFTAADKHDVTFLSSEQLLAELSVSVPLSQTMSEQVNVLMN